MVGARRRRRGVDTTLGEVLGGGGHLPPAATAVNLGRLAEVANPEPADVAAGLVTLVGQTIALVALNAAKVVGMEQTVFVGRLAEFAAVSRVIRAACSTLRLAPASVPGGGGHGHALGAALPPATTG